MRLEKTKEKRKIISSSIELRDALEVELEAHLLLEGLSLQIKKEKMQDSQSKLCE